MHLLLPFNILQTTKIQIYSLGNSKLNATESSQRETRSMLVFWYVYSGELLDPSLVNEKSCTHQQGKENLQNNCSKFSINCRYSNIFRDFQRPTWWQRSQLVKVVRRKYDVRRVLYFVEILQNLFLVNGFLYVYSTMKSHIKILALPVYILST